MGSTVPWWRLVLLKNWVGKWIIQHLQGHLDRLKEWANKNLMKFSKDKYRVLHLGKYNPETQNRLGSIQVGSRSVERDLSDLTDNKLNMSEECAAVAKKANGILLCNSSRDKEDIAMLCCHAQAISEILFPILISAIQKRYEQAAEIPGKGHKDD